MAYISLMFFLSTDSVSLKFGSIHFMLKYAVYFQGRVLVMGTVRAPFRTAAIIFSSQFISLVTIVERLLIECGYY